MKKKISKLTGITTESLRYGFSFPIAFKHFKKWCGDEFSFLIWGMDDIDILCDNMLIHDMATDRIPSAYDIQMIFDAQITKENRQVSLSYARDKIGEPEFEAHDALNDARNTVTICKHLDMVKGLAEYAEIQAKMKYCGGDIKERNLLSASYSAREDALCDPELVNFICPDCGSNVK